jgi:hypothetical protein
MTNTNDVNKAGGWLLEESTPGSDQRRYFKVYELDKQQAIELARVYGATGTVKAVKELTVHEFTGMRPGDVKQHG